MDFNELTQIWNEGQAPGGIKVNQDKLRKFSIRKIRTQLAEIQWTGLFELFINFWFIGFLVDFINRNSYDKSFVIPAVVLLAICLFSMGFELYRLFLYYSIDSKDSVYKTQKKLGKLRYMERIDSLSLLAIIPLFSAPFMIVMAKWLFDFSLYTFGEHLVYYTVGSIIVGIITSLLLVIFPSRKLKEAIKFLKEID